MSYFESLAEEVLLLAFEQLFLEGRPTLDLKNLRLVCRRFQPIVSSLLFKHVAVFSSADFERKSPLHPLFMQSRGLITFLSKDDQIRKQVQTVSIHGELSGNWLGIGFDLQSSLMELIPLLPRLKKICISQVGTTRSPSDRDDVPVLLEAIKKLNSPVRLSIGNHREQGGYLHTFNSQLRLDKITCLGSLQVQLLNIPYFPRHGEPTYSTFDGHPSQDIARIILQNPGLESLHLQLEAKNHASLEHELLYTERLQALDIIGKFMHPLKALTLEGQFHFSASAWSSWGTNLGWASLLRLSLLTESLAQEVTTRLVGKCAALTSLRLDAPHSYSQISPPTPHRFQTDVTPFIASLRLAQLSLVGFHPNNLVALKASGSQVQRLLFHIREGRESWKMPGPRAIRSPPMFTDVLLSPKRLADLQIACPSLGWLAFDVLPFHLPSDSTKSGELCAPMVGHDMDASRNSQATTPSSYGPYARLPGFYMEQMPRGQEKIPDPVFATLTLFRSLRHLRLFVHVEYPMPWSFSLHDAIRTFLWLQKHKVGAPLESLVVYDQRRSTETPAPFIVYDMGMDRVHAEHDETTILYEQEDAAKESCSLKELWRKKTMYEETFSERWERLDPEGYVVPIGWS